MNHTHMPDCWTCLDFGHLENLGPCPECRPDEHAEQHTRRSEATSVSPFFAPLETFKGGPASWAC